ncbi:MAG: ABC transporter ATP-binding protein [Sarcina sp.]
MIKLKNFNYNIGKKQLLENLNINFEKGKTYGIIGPNGAGKSTLLKAIMRINEPKKESIYLKDKDICRYSIKEYSKKIAFVFQENNRDVDFTVEEIIMMGRYPYMELLGSESKEDIEIVKKVMKRLDVEKFKNRYISQLSGGEAQKVFIARALAQGTEILLLDEPTSMLDIHNSVDIMNLVDDMKNENDLTVIMVLHDLNIAFTYCDEIILLEDGKLIINDRKENVLESGKLELVYKDKIKIIEYDNFEYTISPKR